MNKGRSVSPIWPAEREAPEMTRSASERGRHLRMVSGARHLSDSKTEQWIREGWAEARERRDNGVSPLPSAREWASEALDDPPSGEEEVVQGAAPETSRHAQRIIRPWSGLLERALEQEVFPRLLEARRAAEPKAEAAPSAAELGDFVELILADDMAGARGLVEAILRRGFGRTAMLDDLFAPAARRLGVLWEEDRVDFTTVTLGILLLDRLMHETELEAPACHGAPGHDRRALLLPVPGDQHNFGVSVVADVFRGGGWHVWSGKAAARPELLRLVRREAFHVVGFSSTSERLVGQLPSCIRAVRRASRNPDIRVLVGGKYFLENPGEAAAVGADAMARNAREALICANRFVAEMISIDCQAST